MKITLKETRLGLRNSQTRLPFRYGKACLTRCPQAILRATIEVGGEPYVGFSGDCLPPSWFDKSPDKTFSQQIDDMLGAIALAERTYLERLNTPSAFFPAWRETWASIQAAGADAGFTPLLASFGASMLERAVVDAICRAADVPFHRAIHEDILHIEPGDVHAALAGLTPRDWLPGEPKESMYVRHTVGLADPLTAGDVSREERLQDGFPQALEEYIAQTGLRYFKIKVSNQLDRDLDRLKQLAAIVETHRGTQYHVTLDGNEQYGSAQEFDALIAAIRAEPALATLWQNTLVIEQPLERSIALDGAHTQGIRELSRSKPVIIDESDGTLDAYAQAIELGYGGVSSKCCKGVMKSLLNAGLTWVHNARGHKSDYVMTGEDLCTVGVVAVQSDLCLVATLGLEHIERNGHHYHAGLSYLPSVQQDAALEAHGDLYARFPSGRIAPRIVDGRFAIRSLHCSGFGFAVLPDMNSMQSPAEWEFASLGLVE